MRGKGWLLLTLTVRNGITPAYAGKSVSWYLVWSHIQDHPRVCGEKVVIYWRRRCLLGSPPRMRGKVTMNLYPHDIEGITPAYAGKSTGD